MKEIDWANLPFGYMKTDYNVRCYYRDGKWGELELCSEETLNIHMAATCLHYGQEAFEGLKRRQGPCIPSASQCRTFAKYLPGYFDARTSDGVVLRSCTQSGESQRTVYPALRKRCSSLYPSVAHRDGGAGRRTSGK